MPADVRLTKAVVLLDQAKEAVADFVDGVESKKTPAKAQLDAAQQVLAGWWVVLNEAKGMLTDSSIPREAVASMLGEAQWCSLIHAGQRRAVR